VRLVDLLWTLLAAADLAIGEYIKAHSSSDTRLFVWGLEPLVYFLAERPPATRFIHNMPLLTPWSPPAWPPESNTSISGSGDDSAFPR
jgi:hypothetical protein